MRAMNGGIQLMVCRGGGGHARPYRDFPAEGYADRQIEKTLSMVRPIDLNIKPKEERIEYGVQRGRFQEET